MSGQRDVRHEPYVVVMACRQVLVVPRVDFLPVKRGESVSKVCRYPGLNGVCLCLTHNQSDILRHPVHLR